ncbi:MAG: ABC transporter substrate-binding protein, partial [Deltaproteobacteria bacterium]|nr:ABC transporter substrate-binding protein [Deltaproteobacteria bacterium]
MAQKDDKTKGKNVKTRRISRRTAIKTAGVLVGAGIAGVPGALTRGVAVRSAGAAEKPIKIGFQVHRTGIGAVYGRWYERTTTAAVKLINEMGGIAGRPVEVVAEDDGTDP